MMFGLIKSDLYKIFRMKSFYICGILAGLISGLFIFVFDLSEKMRYEMYGIADMYVSPYTGIYSFTLGISFAILFVLILTSMFIQSEFKFGTIKNMAAAGFSKSAIYFSKYISMIFITVVYTLVCGAASFAAGCFLAGAGEFNRAVFLDLLEVFGLFLLAQIALQSIFTMISFFIRSTGWTIVANLLVYLILPNAFEYIDLLVNNWLASVISSVEWLSSWIKIDNFSISKYWPLRYTGEFTNLDYLHMEFFGEILTTGIIVCVAYIVLSTLLGVLVFKKRDID